MKNAIKKISKMTLTEVFESAAARKEKFGCALDEVTCKKFSSLKSIYDFLEEPDVATAELYGEPDESGKIKFPFAVSKHKDNVTEYVGKLGDQTSEFHHETIAEHVALVASNLGRLRKISFLTAMAIAVTHDCAKKYTLGTNAKGEVCFFNHDKLSAYLAACWLSNFSQLGEDWKLVVAVNYAHMAARTDWTQKPEKRTDFQRELEEIFGTRSVTVQTVMNLADRFAELDEGVTNRSQLPITKVKEGITEISRSVFCI